MLVTIQNARPVGGTITAPPSKSMAHRAVLCAALAEGCSHITNLEFSKDISATLGAAAQLCACVRTGADDAVVEGLGHFVSLAAPVDCCESGSTLRFLIPPVESRSYIDMTRSVQAAFGVESRWQDENTLVLPGGQTYHPCGYTVEGDYSQAAFPAVLGAVCGGVTITGLAPDTLQGDAAILDILRRCGARFTRTAEGISFEKAALHGVDIDLADCPDLGPVLMVLGLLCEGTTVIRNAERLRLKESDRIAAMEAELRAVGGIVESEGGTITVQGCAGGLHAPAGVLHGHNDHRVVMSLAVLALSTGIPLTVDDAEAITKSWPNFFEAIKPLGAEVEHVG